MNEAQIAALEALDVPEDYSVDHERALSFLRDQIALWRSSVDLVEARDELKIREALVESGALERNFMSDLSPSFREFFLVSDEARAAGEVFGGLTDAESAYLDTVNAGFEEFGKRVAVFGQTLSRQFADARAIEARARAPPSKRSGMLSLQPSRRSASWPTTSSCSSIWMA